MTSLGNIWIVLVNSVGASTWNHFAIMSVRDRKDKVIVAFVRLLDVEVELVIFDFGKFGLQRIG